MIDILGREDQLGWEKIDKLKPMFEKQMNVFLKFQGLVFLMYCAIHFLINIYIERHDFLGCTSDGL